MDTWQNGKKEKIVNKKTILVGDFVVDYFSNTGVKSKPVFISFIYSARA